MKIILIIATALISLTLNAQEINGTYYEGPDSISINNNHVKFSIRGNDALGIVFTGEGNYEIIDEYMIVATDEYQGVKTEIEIAPSVKKDTIQLQLLNKDGYSIKGVRAEFLNKKSSPISLITSNEDGIILCRMDPKIAEIKVSDLLYDKAIFDYESGKDYTIHLVKNRVLEDKIVIFKLIEGTDKQLTMKLLSTDFNKKSPSLSQLNRLDKKTAAIIDRTRLFKKPQAWSPN